MRSPYILIIDDEHYHLAALSTLLTKNGYQTASVYCAEEAVALMRLQLPDLILCDINMPGKNGIEFCREVQANRRFAAVPFIFCSAMTRAEDIAAAMDAGAHDFIPKPIDANRLLNVIQNHHSTIGVA